MKDTERNTRYWAQGRAMFKTKNLNTTKAKGPNLTY